MSRSYKKSPWVQDGKLREYWRIVRRVSKQFLNMGKEIPNKHEIVNQYNHRDWKMWVTDKKYFRK